MAKWAMKSKVCLVGESAVGKTSLIRKFVLDVFDDSYITTIGTKVSKKAVVFDMDGIQVSVDMMIWDIMGQSSFRAVLQDSYFHGASGVIAVCDATRHETLPALEDWVASVRKVAGDVPLVMLANKADLVAERKVTQNDLELKARRHKAPFMFTSAKTGENVEAAFKAMARAIAERNSRLGR